MYLKLISLVLFMAFTQLSNAQPSKTHQGLMPLPESAFYNGETFRLTKEFTVSIESAQKNERLEAAAERFLRRLSGKTGLFFAQKYLSADSSVTSPGMVIRCTKTAKVELRETEAYILRISKNAVSLTAENDLGILRGLETLLQLLESSPDGYFFTGTSITDSPRFPWRGLMLDCSRHFMPVEVIKRNLDAMAQVKMNVFHWHLTDDQGFRLEMKSLPGLHKKGSDGSYFTQAQVKDILKYANDRGIRVVPEFDIPGHSTAWFVAYPELASAPGPYVIERRWGVFDPVFNPTIDTTYAFFDKFFEEIAKLFPDPYIHIGGDENNGKQWNANPQIQAFMKQNKIENNHALQAYFNRKIQKILEKYGKKMMGWDEILHPDLPKDIMIHSWRGIKYLGESAKMGYQGILSNGYYIDLCQSAEQHYKNDPMPDSLSLTSAEKARILGGEATMWAELITPENIDSRIWPRTAAIAERLWSPASVQDVDDMYRRLEMISLQLEESGITHIRNQETMLRRLAGNNNTAALKTLVSVVEPLKLYNRHRNVSYYTQYAPLTRMVDAAFPEAAAARKFSKTVDDYISGKENARDKIIKQLNTWNNNHEAFLKLSELSPALKECEPISLRLQKLSALLLDVLDGKLKPEDAAASFSSLIKEAKEPAAELHLMVAAPMEKLYNSLKK